MRAGDNFCPGILNAVPAKDGLLIRIRLPGGLIEATQLSAIAKAAAEYADGQVEITSRANIQLRAISTGDLPKVIEELSAAGLLPSPAHDRVRNITASPLAGLDREDLLDTRPLVRSLDQHLLADPLLADLPPKFSMALDGGGRWFSDEIDDLALRAFRFEDTELWHLSIGGISTGLAVTTERAVDCLLQAAKGCLRACSQFGVTARGRVLATHPAAWGRVVSGLSAFSLPCTKPEIVRGAADAPLGVATASQRGCVNVVPSVPLGRLSAHQVGEIAAIAADRAVDLRLAGWRGIVLGSAPEHALAEVLRVLADVKLSTDGSDGYLGMAACAGITGCDASLGDVRRDAAALARLLAGRDLKPGWKVTIAGCEKQCAMRTPTRVKLVASEAGYRMTVDGAAVYPACSPDRAIDAITSFHASLASEVIR